MKNKKQSSDRAGTFMENQQAVDKAINERTKSERGSGQKKANEDTGNRNNKSDVSRKNTGGGKQSSPGD